MSERIRTHWEGCEREHLDCALARLQDAERRAEQAEGRLRADAEREWKEFMEFRKTMMADLAAAERRAEQAESKYGVAPGALYISEESLAAARSQLREAQAALRKVEWASVFHIANKMISGCPECAHSQADGHAADCIIGRALASPPTQGPQT